MGVPGMYQARAQVRIRQQQHRQQEQLESGQEGLEMTQKYEEETTSLEEVVSLATEYTTQWVPQCEHFLSYPPDDPESKSSEYTRLTTSLMAQIVLKADGIESQGDERARLERKVLLRNVQDMLRKLDASVGRGFNIETSPAPQR